MVTRIAVLDDYQQASHEFGSWTKLHDCEVHAFDDHVDGDALVERVRGFDVVVAMRERTELDAAFFEALPELRLVATTGMANAAIDTAAAARRGVLVCGTSGIVTNTIELAWGLILALLRHIPAEHASVQQGGWQHTMGGDLAGRTLGLLGLGRTGTAMARIARAFEMNVIAWSENLTEAAAAERGASWVSKQALLSEADVLSVHLVLSARTRGLLGEAELRHMRPDSVLVNTSRGPIIDEAALVRALREKWIAGAALDVYDSEPLGVSHPLRAATNVVLTPHIGYVTRNCYQLFYEQIVENIAAWTQGAPVRVIT